MDQGHKSRAVSAHFMNDRSSRSHTILTLWIETTNKGKVLLLVLLACTLRTTSAHMDEVAVSNELHLFVSLSRSSELPEFIT